MLLQKLNLNLLTEWAGFGLEIPCVYRLYRHKIYIDKMKEIVASLSSDELL